MSKKLTLIACVLALVLSAASAFAYDETWDGWFKSGILYYGVRSYTHSGTSGTAYDSTYSVNRDTFYAIIWPANYCFVSADNDTIFLIVSEFNGGKVTGTSGTKEGLGTWSGTAVRCKNGVETTFTEVSGTWDTDDVSKYFYYPNEGTPTYTADWEVTSSTPSGLTGDGDCDGERKYYSP